MKRKMTVKVIVIGDSGYFYVNAQSREDFVDPAVRFGVTAGFRKDATFRRTNQP